MGHDGGDGFFISFLSSSGGLALGALVNPPNSALTECTAYPYEPAVSIDNDSYPYKTFIIRNGARVYTAGGSNWGSVAAGRRVACKTAMAGDTKFYLKGINYVEKSDGTWVKVTGDGVSYGFVDTGLRSGSAYSKINMYGSW